MDGPPSELWGTIEFGHRSVEDVRPTAPPRIFDLFENVGRDPGFD